MSLLSIEIFLVTFLFSLCAHNQPYLCVVPTLRHCKHRVAHNGLLAWTHRVHSDIICGHCCFSNRILCRLLHLSVKSIFNITQHAILWMITFLRTTTWWLADFLPVFSHFTIFFTIFAWTTVLQCLMFLNIYLKHIFVTKFFSADPGWWSDYQNGLGHDLINYLPHLPAQWAVPTAS